MKFEHWQIEAGLLMVRKYSQNLMVLRADLKIYVLFIPTYNVSVFVCMYILTDTQR